MNDTTTKLCCWMCGATLRPTYGTASTVLGYGYYGDGLFCSLRCGYRWARSAIREASAAAGSAALTEQEK